MCTTHYSELQLPAMPTMGASWLLIEVKSFAAEAKSNVYEEEEGQWIKTKLYIDTCSKFLYLCTALAKGQLCTQNIAWLNMRIKTCVCKQLCCQQTASSYCGHEFGWLVLHMLFIRVT